MITQETLDGIVRRWAVTESFHRGYECEPILNEFDKGWVIWAPYPPGTAQNQPPGSGKTEIIDRETGEITIVPGLPPAVATKNYMPRQERPDAGRMPQMADPASFYEPPIPMAERERRAALTEAELIRYTNGGQFRLPQIAAELTIGDRKFTALGHTDDTTPAHHPLVWQAISSIAPPNRNRGAERHPELIALSKALFSWFGQNSADLSQVRSLLGAARVQLRSFTEGSDPYVEAKAYSCHTVRAVLIALGLPGNPPPDLVAPPVPPKRAGDLTLERDLITQDLIQVALQPGLRYQLPVFAFLPELLAPYGSLYGVIQSAPGQAQRVEGFTINSHVSMPVADTLGDAGVLIGAKLFPIGEDSVGLTSIMAIDERQRVFAIDHVGIWYLGASLDEAVQTLLTGAATPRVRADGTW